MRLIILAATFSGLLSGAVTAQTVAPPILPGEVYAETANGCGVIFSATEIAAGSAVSAAIESWRKNAWYGRCVDGLIDGDGQVGSPGDPISFLRYSYVLGRGITSKRRDEEKRLTTYLAGGQFVDIYDGPKPFGPRWGYDNVNVYAPDMKHWISARRDRCMEQEKKTKKFGCRSTNDYRAFVLWVLIDGESKQLVCPDPRTSEGCDKLWMTEGKPVFDKIEAFVAPIETELSERRVRYLSFITPAWRSQAAARQLEIESAGTAGQIVDMVASSIVVGNLPEAIRLHELVARRFPGSQAIESSKLHLTTLYCLQSAPELALATDDAAETTRIFQSEPCRQTGVAPPLLFSSKTVLDQSAYRSSIDAERAAGALRYQAERRRERDAYWGSMLGVITGVLANSAAPAAATPTYSGSALPATNYGSPATQSAYPGQSARGSGAESIAHNPANESYSCIAAIDKNGFAASGVRSVMGAVFRNKCAYSVEVTWCVVGSDCNPGYSNIATVLGNSDRGISYDAGRAGQINWAACRLGFTRAQGDLSRVFQHACK